MEVQPGSWSSRTASERLETSRLDAYQYRQNPLFQLADSSRQADVQSNLASGRSAQLSPRILGNIDGSGDEQYSTSTQSLHDSSGMADGEMDSSSSDSISSSSSSSPVVSNNAGISVDQSPSRDATEISIRNLSDRLRLIATESSGLEQVAQFINAHEARNLYAENTDFRHTRQFQRLWRSYVGLFIIFLFTIGWSIFYLTALRSYHENFNNSSCTFKYSPWFSNGVVISRIGDNLSSLPFLLMWGIISQFLPLVSRIRKYVHLMQLKVAKCIVHLFVYKSNVPWYAMLCISVAQWHYCRIDVTPRCPRSFIQTTHAFSIYSTVYVIFAVVGLHAAVGYWVLQEDQHERQREFRARVEELENQIQHGRIANTGPPIIQVGDLLRILLAQDQVSRGCPGLADKLDSVNWSEFQNTNEETECSICFISFDEELDITRCPCDHYFHKKCLACWFEVADTCPLCRKSCRIAEPPSTEFGRIMEHPTYVQPRLRS